VERSDVTDDERTALIHAELDGDLTSEQRAAFARLLLAEPQTRKLRDELQGLCRGLDAVGQVEAPPQLKDSILSRLPPVPATAVYHKASLARWRLAAMVAGLLTAVTIVYQTVQGPGPGSRETAGTMAANGPTAIDSVVVTDGPVTGRATLYRDKAGLAVGLDVSAAEPVDVLVTAGDRSFRINGLGSSNGGADTRRTIALSGVGIHGQPIDLSFLIGDRTVSRATLHAPPGP
jgi:hypothetical protein